MKRVTLLVPAVAMIASAALTWEAQAPLDPARRHAPNVPADTATRRYDVRLGWTGYTGTANSADCDRLANPRGYDSLTGILTGIEDTSRPGDGTLYHGTLRRHSKLDYCLSQGRRDDNDDEQMWCIVSLVGAAKMQVELEVYGESGRGAWLRAEPDSVPVDSVRVGGTCRQTLLAEVRDDYPGGTSAGSPDGQPIAEPRPPLFFVSGLPKLRVGQYPSTGDSPWSLQVVRQLP